MRSRTWIFLWLSLGTWLGGIEAAPQTPGQDRTPRSSPGQPVAPDPALIETQFIQVSPAGREGGTFQRSKGQKRAILLLPGLKIHPFSSYSGVAPEFHSWQKPGSTLIKELNADADVFAFAYSQTASVDAIADHPGLAKSVRRLESLGYSDIVLIGHSAGGLIVRRFVEDYPDSGVTKVIQVCCPNGGCGSAKFDSGIPSVQRAFVESLTREARMLCLKNRNKTIPEKVQFVIVIGTGAGDGDGVVPIGSQWPEDLQKQGIPAFPLQTTHFTVMRSKPDAQTIAAIVREKQPRWNARQVADMKKTLEHIQEPDKPPKSP